MKITMVTIVFEQIGITRIQIHTLPLVVLSIYTTVQYCTVYKLGFSGFLVLRSMVDV